MKTADTAKTGAKKAPAKKTAERKQPDATSGVDEKKSDNKAPAKKSAAKKK